MNDEKYVIHEPDHHIQEERHIHGQGHDRLEQEHQDQVFPVHAAKGIDIFPQKSRHSVSPLP